MTGDERAEWNKIARRIVNHEQFWRTVEELRPVALALVEPISDFLVDGEAVFRLSFGAHDGLNVDGSAAELQLPLVEALPTMSVEEIAAVVLAFDVFLAAGLGILADRGAPVSAASRLDRVVLGQALLLPSDSLRQLRVEEWMLTAPGTISIDGTSVAVRDGAPAIIDEQTSRARRARRAHVAPAAVASLADPGGRPTGRTAETNRWADHIPTVLATHPTTSAAQIRRTWRSTNTNTAGHLLRKLSTLRDAPSERTLHQVITEIRGR